MQQSLQFLQAPALELQSLVQQEIEINPVLEESPDEGKPETDADDWDKQLKELRQKDEEWREYFAQSNTPAASYNPEAAERRQFHFDSQVEAPHLADHLMRQLTLSTSTPDMIRVGEEIIGNIDDAGFLKVQLVEVAQSARVEYAVAQTTLDLIQTFDPVGVAALLVGHGLKAGAEGALGVEIGLGLRALLGREAVDLGLDVLGNEFGVYL